MLCGAWLEPHQAWAKRIRLEVWSKEMNRGALFVAVVPRFVIGGLGLVSLVSAMVAFANRRFGPSWDWTCLSDDCAVSAGQRILRKNRSQATCNARAVFENTQSGLFFRLFRFCRIVPLHRKAGTSSGFCSL
jgi:hypothetical protein